LLVLWAIGVGVTTYVALDRDSSLEVFLSGPLAVSLECLIIRWFLRSPLRHHWISILLAAFIPFILLLAIAPIVMRPSRLASDVRWGAYAYAGYQLLVFITLLLYAVVVRSVAQHRGDLPQRSGNAA